MSRDHEAVTAAVLRELERAARRRFAPWMAPSQLAAALRVPPGDVRRSLARLAVEGRAERALLEAGGKVVESWRALHALYVPLSAE